jgi:hypothetical protein
MLIPSLISRRRVAAAAAPHHVETGYGAVTHPAAGAGRASAEWLPVR